MEKKSETTLEKFYIYIPTFTKDNYRNPKFYLTIQGILQSKPYRYLLFKDLEAVYLHKKRERADSLFPIECEIDKDCVEEAWEYFLIKDSATINTNTNCFMKAIYVDKHRVESSFHSGTQEEKHVRDIKHSKYLLKTKPESYLSQIPVPLRPLLFIDYKLFDRYLEHARHYDKREPGSVADLLKGFTEVVVPHWGPLTQDYKLTLNHIEELHRTVAKSLFNSNKEKAGKIRTNHSSFPLTLESTSVQGILELLQRIKNETNNYFVIGEHYSYDVFNQFLGEMRNYISANYQEKELIHTVDTVSKRELLNTLKNIAIDSLFKKQSIKDIPWEEVLIIIEQGLKSYESILNSYCNNNRSLGMQLFYCIPQLKTKCSHSIEEHNINIQYLRKNGWNKDYLLHFSDDELEALAQSLYAALENGQSISIFPPAPEHLEMLIEKAIAVFNRGIQKSHTFRQKLSVIDAFIHDFEITHIFDDGNCRTAYLLLNELLIKVDIKWTVLYDPNRFDAYSRHERISEIKHGILRFEFMVDNQKSILEKYKQCEDRFLLKTASKKTNPYHENQFFQENKTVDPYSEAEWLAKWLFDVPLDDEYSYCL